MKDLIEDRRLHGEVPYEAYQAAWADHVQRPLAGLDKKQRRYLYYARYNKERSERVHQAYEVSAKLREALATLDRPQRWMVLTEDWCLDSAYCLPVLVEAARLNPLIDLGILRRDDHLDVMDRYLTGTARSIPKLVAFSEDGGEFFQWGPRPEAARLLRERLLAQGLNSGDVSKNLLAWYEEGGWRFVDDELTQLLTPAQ